MKSEGQKKSKQHEVRLAKVLDGKRNAGSGAFWSRKGDVRSKDVLVEHKWTGKTSFTLKAAVLEKIVKEAILDSRMPVLGISLNDEDYCILTENDFLELLHNFQEHKTCTKKISDPNLGDIKPNVEE
jgi:GH43 family beta-xylosidase